MWEAILAIPLVAWTTVMQYGLPSQIAAVILYVLAIALVYWGRRHWYPLIMSAVVAMASWLPYLTFGLPLGREGSGDKDWARFFESLTIAMGVYCWPVIFLGSGFLAVLMTQKKQATPAVHPQNPRRKP